MTPRPRSRSPFRWLMASLVLIMAVTAAAFWVSHQWTIYERHISTYGRVSLGDSREDVRYKMGEPVAVNGEVINSYGAVRADSSDRNSDLVTEMPAIKTIDQYNAWKYLGENPPSHFNIYFDAHTGRTYAIDCIDVLEAKTSLCPPLLGVWIGDAESKVNAIFGEPSREIVGNGVKTLNYDDIGISLRLSKQQVYGIQIRGGAEPKHATVNRFVQWLLNH